jgi:hypothetical protein
MALRSYIACVSPSEVEALAAGSSGAFGSRDERGAEAPHYPYGRIQWRICFVWRDGDAYEVEIVDYH